MKALRWTIVVVLLLTQAVPAHADGHDAGVLVGDATVGKAFAVADPCDPGGGALIAPGSPGIGMPLVNAPKAAVFAFAGMAVSALHGAGPLLACGDLLPVASNLPPGGVGAACGMTKGMGMGSFLYPGTLAHPGPGALFLTDVLWKAVVGGVIPVTAQYAPVMGAPPVGMVVALLDAQGGSDCLTKTDGPPKAGGTGGFTVVGVFAAVHGGLVDPNTVVPLGLGGKCPAFPPCVYGGPK